MCGICGRLNFDADARVAPALLKAMADTISHRGPDDEGYYASGSMGLGFRRLSIIDLNTGHQPLSNEDGTAWVVFNGEIYNYQDLRTDLQQRNHTFKTNTDTEVIVHLYEEFGVRGALSRLRGMFAFALWDSAKKLLVLARDRVGIKPLYYTLTKQSVVFGSEIKAILADPEVQAEIAPEVIDMFLTFYYLPGEETLFRNIKKVPPASYLLVQGGRTSVEKYWELDFTTRPRSIAEAARDLEEIFAEVVRLHMISDVPVGVLLSGGVDSTAVLSYAAHGQARPLSSFTLGFNAAGVTDERPYARLAARANGTDHHDLTMTADQFRDFLPRYVWHMEEPVCEPPGIPLYYVSKLAKDYVKVLLAGEGGDEAFGGYQTYRSVLWLERLKRVLGPLNGVLAAASKRANTLIHSARLAKYGALLGIPFDSYYYSRASAPNTFFNQNKAELYSKEFGLLQDNRRTTRAMKEFVDASSRYDLVNRMLSVDTKSWLPDDLLIKADKITMANSIELRVPLLDHKLLEFAASLPGHYKVRGLTTKYLAKKVLGRRVPKEILNRRKTGFSVPYTTWFQNELRDWLHDLLLGQRSLARGYFDRTAVERLLATNARTGWYSKEVFSLTVLELWHRTFLGEARPRHGGQSALPEPQVLVQ